LEFREIAGWKDSALSVASQYREGGCGTEASSEYREIAG